ncbi:MAG: DUF72 domain-containing protein [Desulfobacteraceae bacterium]|nr:MAG: DUF72 domain-containing protein [Desulfobacteraceae bacterium]
MNDSPSRDFRFRGLHPMVRIGTASDRYAGWLGQIYSPERFGGRVSTRVNRVGGRSFQETVLPVESVEEYFQHFAVLELDSTFYSLLLDEQLQPTPLFRLLEKYRTYLKQEDRLILKVPQTICARRLLRRGEFTENPDCFRADIFTSRFLEPATALLGESIAAFVFEQEYLRKEEERAPVREFAALLERFFSEVPPDERYHMEVRTDALLQEPYFRVLEKFGIGQVLSHWTWLPSLKAQFRKSGKRFLNSGSSALIRLMTPRGIRYEKAYAMAFPFDREVEGMMTPGMVEQTADLMITAIEKGVTMHVVINNRAGGNAPLIAGMVSKAFSEQF